MLCQITELVYSEFRTFGVYRIRSMFDGTNQEVEWPPSLLPQPRMHPGLPGLQDQDVMVSGAWLPA
jgi:hypothetical protein